jgi:chloramphenicol 3-O phosphotransferase
MPVQVIVLNGGSSAGKTGIARCLHAILPEPWISLSVDDLVNALPQALTDSGSGIAFGQHGEVLVGAGFREIEAAWMAGVAAMARAGARIIFDDVFLSGAASQERVRAGLEGLAWRCCGWGCAAPPRSRLAGRSPAATGPPGWPPRRQRRLTKASSTISRSTPVIPNRSTAPASSPGA